MEFREYLKGRLLDFLLIQAGITLAIGVIGLMGEPEKQIRPLIMFVPFLYAFFCVLVSFGARTWGRKFLFLFAVAGCRSPPRRRRARRRGCWFLFQTRGQ